MEGLWKDYPNAVGKSILTATVMPTNATNFTAMATTAATTLATMSTVAFNATTVASNVTEVSSCFKVDPNWGHMFRPIDDPEYPWIGLWFSVPVTGIWYWCTDQVR